MKITDDERKVFNEAVKKIERDIQAGQKASRFMLEDILRLAKSEQAAWQEVDRLQKKNKEQLKRIGGLEMELCDQECYTMRVTEENERLRSQRNDALDTLQWYVDSSGGEYEMDRAYRAKKAIQRIKGESGGTSIED